MGCSWGKNVVPALFFLLHYVGSCYGIVIDVILAKFETSFLAKFFLVRKSLIKFPRAVA